MRRTIFAQPKPGCGERRGPEKNLIYHGKEIIMEYLVVLATMLMIAAYAFIIGRTLHNSEHH
jgi:hypothetical protein